jgi:hypothetical protein
MVPEGAPGWLFPAAVATALLVSAAWWTFVALCFASPPVRRGYARVRRLTGRRDGRPPDLLGGRLLVSR